VVRSQRCGFHQCAGIGPAAEPDELEVAVGRVGRRRHVLGPVAGVLAPGPGDGVGAGPDDVRDTAVVSVDYPAVRFNGFRDDHPEFRIRNLGPAGLMVNAVQFQVIDA
jgi:hypothetical protein